MFLPGPNTPRARALPSAAVVVRRPSARAAVARRPLTSLSPSERLMLAQRVQAARRAGVALGDDELGFSFGNVFKNIGNAVTKAVKDVSNEAQRAAKNPLVQAAALALPGGVVLKGASLLAKGKSLVDAAKSSRAGQLVQAGLTAQQSGATGAGIATAAINALNTPPAADPNNAAVYGRSAGTDVARRAAAAARKATQGKAIQDANAARAAAEKTAADAKAAIDKMAADARDASRAAARAKKAAEGQAIQDANAAKAKAAEDALAAEKKKSAQARKKLKAATDAAAKLQADAEKAAAAGDADKAAALRAQADQLAQGARSVAVSSGAAAEAQMPAGGAPVYTAPVQGPGADGTVAPGGISGKTLAIGGAVLAASVAAVMLGGGGHRGWR